MWFRREQKKNRRLHRNHVLDVKLRSDQVRATRLRLLMMSCAIMAGTVLGLYVVWRLGETALNVFVYRNADFAIRHIDVQTDGKIAPDELRHWSGVKPGMNLIGLDLVTVKRNLELVSAIDSVSVERVLPQTLRIRVRERTPVAQVNVPEMKNGAMVVKVFQLDAGGMVMQPLDPRLCTVPISQLNSELPVITGVNAFQLQPGRRVDLPQVQAALQLIAAFGTSPMAGLVDVRYLDVASPGVIRMTTGQGGQITFGLENPGRQLRRWREIYDFGLQRQRAIASANLAVDNNVPVRWMMADDAPAAGSSRTVQPQQYRRRHV